MGRKKIAPENPFKRVTISISIPQCLARLVNKYGEYTGLGVSKIVELAICKAYTGLHDDSELPDQVGEALKNAQN